MLFYEEQSCFLAIDNSITSCTYTVPLGQKETPAGTPLQGEVQKSTGIMEQPDAKQQFFSSHGAHGLLLVAVPESYSPLMVVPGLSQDLGPEVHLS